MTDESGAVDITGSRFSHSEAESGGALYFSGAAADRPVVATLTDTLLEGCTARANTPRGGAIAAFTTALTLVNTTLLGNTVTAVELPSGPFDAPQCFQPFGSGAGGGIFAFEGVVAITRGSVLSGNVANLGGGAYIGGITTSPAGVGGGCRVSVSGSVLSSNSAAATSGGALFLENVLSATLENATLSRNTAASDGAGLYLLDVLETVFSGVNASGNRRVRCRDR